MLRYQYSMKKPRKGEREIRMVVSYVAGGIYRAILVEERVDVPQADSVSGGVQWRMRRRKGGSWGGKEGGRTFGGRSSIEDGEVYEYLRGICSMIGRLEENERGRVVL